jgi:Asp-tRNA(Asn)/Glu-tRNA(Gln) amidotransferase A subunit family amidase
MPAASLQTLLARSIDYAGMFPPCSLDLESALRNQAEYVRSPDAWMLGAFVLPVEQFDAARQLLSKFDPLHPLRVAALGPKTSNADDFLDAVEKADEAIRWLSSNVDLVSISHLEMLLSQDVGLASLNEVRSILGDLPVFWEAPPDKAQQTIALLAEHNSDADLATFGYKLRTGGVTADAFPTSAQIADALVTPATHQLPIKFTAGLHHPIRQFRDEVKTKMHGFLNVLGAAVLAAEHRWDAHQTSMMLEGEKADSFSFTDEFFAWREWKISIERLQYRRKFVASFGSCSFDEPRDDLRALGLL